MADSELAGRLAAAGYRVPARLYWAGKHFVAYALPREFDGLLQEARATSTRGRGRRFGHSPESWGRTARFSICHETGGTLLWVYVPAELARPPADDVMEILIRDTPEYTVYPYNVRRVRRLRESAA